MQRYLQQLIADIRQARRDVPEAQHFPHDFEDDFIGGILEWEYAPEHPMSYHFSLDKNIFPPDRLLNDEQINLLVREMQSLWKAYNFFADFPDGLPNRMRYNLMLQQWEKPIQYVSDREMQIEFCDYDPAKCIFGKDHCMCRKYNEGWELS